MGRSIGVGNTWIRSFAQVAQHYVFLQMAIFTSETKQHAGFVNGALHEKQRQFTQAKRMLTDQLRQLNIEL